MTPTISLMQDQVHKLNYIQVPSVFLESGQLDKLVEMHALNPDSDKFICKIDKEQLGNKTQ